MSRARQAHLLAAAARRNTRNIGIQPPTAESGLPPPDPLCSCRIRRCRAPPRRIEAPHRWIRHVETGFATPDLDLPLPSTSFLSKPLPPSTCSKPPLEEGARPRVAAGAGGGGQARATAGRPGPINPTMRATRGRGGGATAAGTCHRMPTLEREGPSPHGGEGGGNTG